MNDDRTGPTVSEIKPFHQVLNLAGNSHMDMQAWGIMLIPEEDLLPNTPYPQGLYLLVGAYGGSSSGTSTTTWNPYPYNPKWQPESLLCNSWWQPHVIKVLRRIVVGCGDLGIAPRISAVMVLPLPWSATGGGRGEEGYSSSSS